MLEQVLILEYEHHLHLYIIQKLVVMVNVDCNFSTATFYM